MEKIKDVLKSFKYRLKTVYTNITTQIDRRPLVSFFIGLIILFLLIVLSNFISRPQPTTKTQEVEPKKVSTYTIGSAPTVSMQAQIEKTGVIIITALTPGVVNEINVVEGQTVGRGANLIWLANNYQGGNMLSLQRQLAARQYASVKETQPIQKDLIAKQKEIAKKADSNTDELRDITQKSIDETKSLISLNEEIFDSLDDNIINLENTNSNGSNDALILSTKQIQSQVLAGLTQARSGLRQAEYQVNTDKPPTKLAELQKDITLKQLELQDKLLDLNVEMSHIQLQIAYVNEAMMHPVAPSAGTIQRVHVRLGQAVNPGTPLITLSSNQGEMNAVLYVPSAFAQRISKIEPSMLFIQNEKISLLPSYISQEAVQGSLYTVKYSFPEDMKYALTDKSYIRVVVPVGYADTSASVPFVPLDAVYQTKDAAYIFVNKDDKAVSKKINLGAVYGQFVEVVSGLDPGDMVITDRNVIEGDRVSEH